MDQPAGDDDRLLAVPGGVVGHDAGMGAHVLWGQLGQLVRLGVDPAQGLELPQVLVLGQALGQLHPLVGAALGPHHDAADLLHLGVVHGAGPVQVARYLRSF